MGWGPYQNDHEDANGQFEMNWDYTDCLTTADRHVFFKYVIHNVAQAYGKTATFMPKPIAELTMATGMHVNMSIWKRWQTRICRR